MAKGEAKKTNRMIDESYNAANQGYNRFLNTANAGLAGAIGSSGDLRNQIAGLYGNAAGGSLSPNISKNAQGFFNMPSGMGGGGGVNFGSIGDYGRARGTFQDIAKTGGDFGESMDAFRSLARGGGIDADALRYRATSQIPSFYGTMKNEAARRRNVQGGYSPAFDESMAEMARQAGRESFNASRMAEADISDRMQRGLMAGAQGMAGIQGQMAGNRLSGAQGLFGLGQAEQQAMATNASLADAAAGRNLGFQTDLLRMEQAGKMAGMEGLSNLYRSAPGDVGMYLDAALGGLGGRTQGANAFTSTRAQYNPNISWLDRIMQGAGIAGGAAGAYIGRPR